MKERETEFNFINEEGRYTDSLGERYMLIVPRDLPQWKKDAIRKTYEGWEVEER